MYVYYKMKSNVHSQNMGNKTQNACYLYWNDLSCQCRFIKMLVDMCGINAYHIFVTIKTQYSLQGQLQIFPGQFLINEVEGKEFPHIKIQKLGDLPIWVDEDGRLVNSLMEILMSFRKYQKIQYLYEYPSESTLISAINKSKILSWHYFTQNSPSSALPSTLHLILSSKSSQNLPTQQKITQFISQIKSTMTQIEQQKKLSLKNNQKHDVRIGDLLEFFRILDLVYFGVYPFEYPNIGRWFKKIYTIKQVKTITHQWFPFAKEINKYIETEFIQNSKL